MVSVEEAKSILLSNVFRSEKTSLVKIQDSLNHFLAEDIKSKYDLPPFDQSNVDGYALKLSQNLSYKISGEVKAGDNAKTKLKAGSASRIFTGAMVPPGADCVIMQEMVSVNGKQITFPENKLKSGDHIRKKGSQIKKGDAALPAETYITPAVLGFLAALGIDKVKVYSKPVIHLIITGNEIIKPGSKLSAGKVFDSNSFALEAMLSQTGVKAEKIFFVKDEKAKLKSILKNSLSKADVILISGGISVGKYDLVNETLTEFKCKQLFYKVAQRPGKPLYFGKHKDTYIFALPGNPSSVMTCYYEYVFPALKKIMGYKRMFLFKKKLKSPRELTKNFRLGHFLKAKAANGYAEPLDGQASYIIRSFVDANCFIYLPAEKNYVRKGEEVEVHLFPD